MLMPLQNSGFESGFESGGGEFRFGVEFRFGIMRQFVANLTKSLCLSPVACCLTK